MHSHHTPLIMGVLNVTPDSFSGDGLMSPDAAYDQALRMIDAGADIIDIGAESSRPGALLMGEEEEWRRLAQVVGRIARKVTVSVDTFRAATARKACAEGAHIINDIQAATADEAMLSVVAEAGAAYIAMHMRGTPQTMQQALTPYDDVVKTVADFLKERVALARQAGIQTVYGDPGIGFGKSFADNWRLIHQLHTLADIGSGLVMGCSRKRFLNELFQTPPDITARDQATALVSMLAYSQGARILRVHAVQPCVIIKRIAESMHAAQ